MLLWVKHPGVVVPYLLYLSRVWRQSLRDVHGVRNHTQVVRCMEPAHPTGFDGVRTKAKLREAANDHMAMLEQNPERVIGYFQDRYVRYAA